jgi:hypothetical protein
MIFIVNLDGFGGSSRPVNWGVSRWRWLEY